LTESDGSGQDWFELVCATRHGGISGNILQNCVVESWHEAEVRLVLVESHSALYSPDHANEIAQALSESLGREINVTITVGPLGSESPAIRRRREKQNAIDAAHHRFSNDPGVLALIADLDAEIDSESLVIHQRV